MASYTEPMRPYEFVLADHGNISYESVTLNSGSGTITAGSVLGRITKRQAAAPIPAVAGGTGNGTMSLLTFGADVQVGSYVIQCIEAVEHGGVFSVTAPDGTALPNFSMGTTTGGTARYTSSHLSFSLTDNTDFITANSFTVVVTAGGTPAVVGGTGNGAMSAITLGKLAQLGTYKVVMQPEPWSHGGDFEVIAPDGPITNTVGRFGYASDGGADSFTSAITSTSRSRTAVLISRSATTSTSSSPAIPTRKRAVGPDRRQWCARVLRHCHPWRRGVYRRHRADPAGRSEAQRADLENDGDRRPESRGLSPDGA
jgi:hypothetical protein